MRVLKGLKHSENVGTFLNSISSLQNCPDAYLAVGIPSFFGNFTGWIHRVCCTTAIHVSSVKSLKDGGENLMIPMSFGPHPECQLTWYS